MKANITSFDVARLAGLSQSGVSRSCTPGASVAALTRRKVLDAARKLGYRPNAHARSLITKRSRIIGLVLSYLENLFYAIALERLTTHPQRDGYHVLLFGRLRWHRQPQRARMVAARPGRHRAANWPA